MIIWTEDEMHLYERMGFKTVEHVHKYKCDTYKFSNHLANREVTLENFSESEGGSVFI